jgi:sphingosine kinase
MTVFHTQYEKHAYDYTLEMNIKHYDGIVCCSGDGIVHEVINAIFHREDKDEFIKTIPIGVIPGGTSNGFAKSLCVASGENYNPELCSFLIIKGFYREIDILEVETPSREKNIYSFLSVAWGLIADIDLESELYLICFN